MLQVHESKFWESSTLAALKQNKHCYQVLLRYLKEKVGEQEEKY